MLHEAIPVTGTIVSGTYNDLNIKNYAHGIFQSVFDYPYLSSSANHIFDITAGYATGASLSSSTNVQNSKKVNIYNEMAQILVGFDETGSVRKFDEDGDLTGGTKLQAVYFLNFARLLQKDEIKKGSFTLELGTSASANSFGTRITLQDISGKQVSHDVKLFLLRKGSGAWPGILLGAPQLDVRPLGMGTSPNTRGARPRQARHHNSQSRGRCGENLSESRQSGLHRFAA